MNCPHCNSTGKSAGQYKDGTKKYRCTKDGCRKYFKADETVDIAEDTLEAENTRVNEPSRGKAGPKKVFSEAGKAIVNNVAGIVADSSQVKLGREKGLSYQEAQSIVHPTTRIAWRHIPITTDMIPDIPGVDKEDLADAIEIATTLAKYAIRRFSLWYHNWRTKELNKSNPQVQKAMQTPEPPALEDFEENPPDPMATRQQPPVATASSNGHSAMVAMLPGDFGMAEV